MQSLAEVPREQFVLQMAEHLEALYPLVLHGCQHAFRSAAARAALRNQVRLLIDCGFATAYEFASAFELFNVFGLDPQSECVSRVLNNNSLPTGEKLDRLQVLAGLQEAS